MQAWAKPNPSMGQGVGHDILHIAKEVFGNGKLFGDETVFSLSVGSEMSTTLWC